MNKQQMIDAGRAEGVSDKVIQRRLIAAGFSADLDAAADAETYERRHDAIVARYVETMQRIRQQEFEIERETTAAMLKLNLEFGIDGGEQQIDTPDEPEFTEIKENNAQIDAENAPGT